MWNATWFETRPTGRLTPIDRSDELYPWLRARELETCQLYWIPSYCPLSHDQREWFSGFLDRLIRLLENKLALRPYVFVQYKTIIDHPEPFELHTFDFQPRIGLSRKPGVKPELRTKKLPDDPATVNVPDLIPDYCYWLTAGGEPLQRGQLFGYGGVTYGFRTPDPGTIPPPIPFSEKFQSKSPIFQAIDVKGLLARVYTTQDGFQVQSKQLLGGGLEQEPQFRGLPFILPRLNTQDFFHRPASEIASWFELFSVYLCESPQDGGLFLASKLDIEPRLIRLLQHMSKHELTYPDPRW